MSKPSIHTAADLCCHLASKYNLLWISLCQLHKPCKVSRGCGSPQLFPLIDFDEVEKAIHQGKPSQPSVDGIGHKNSRLVLVEIKGWSQFIHYQEPLSQERIKEQVASYDLQGKLQSSIAICLSESVNPTLLDDMSPIYIVVTDIDITINPLELFAIQLLSLSETSSEVNWQTFCNHQLQSAVDNISYQHIPVYYKSCHEFDKFINNIPHSIRLVRTSHHPPKGMAESGR